MILRTATGHGRRITDLFPSLALFGSGLIFRCLGWMPFLFGDCRAFSLVPIARTAGAVRGPGGGLPRIIGHVPAAPLELNGRRRQNSLELACAFLTLGQRRVREFLDFLNVLSALRANVLVKRQFNLLRKALPTIISARLGRVKMCMGVLTPRCHCLSELIHWRW